MSDRTPLLRCSVAALALGAANACASTAHVRGPLDSEMQYNILIRPRVEPLAPAVVLLAGSPTEIEFYVGPAVPESVATGLGPSPYLEELGREDSVPLTVTLYSMVSTENTFQEAKLRLDWERGLSTVGRFTIVPSVDAVGGEGGLGELVFVVDSRGMEIDVVKVPVYVGAPPDSVELQYPTKLELAPMAGSELQIPDLVLGIAPGGGDAIPITLRAFNPDLHEALTQAIGNPRPSGTWVLLSGMNSADLAHRIEDAYLDLRALVEMNNKELQRVYAALGATSLEQGAEPPVFSERVRDQLLERLHRTGGFLYKSIFWGGDERLHMAMALIHEYDEERGGPPLRVRIVSDRVYAPWQLLCPPMEDGEVDSNGFWGFRYELSALQLINRAQGRSRTLEKRPAPAEVVVATWKSTGPEDEVHKRGMLLAERLAGELGGPVRVCTSRDTFESELKSGSPTLKFILAYTHGTSGNELVVSQTATGPNVLTLARTVEGPCLIFAVDDLLSWRAIEYLQRDASSHFLEAQPIVVLNACETAKTRNATSNGFVGAFTRLGARSIVVTEAPVWANFAHYFGQDLIEALFEGGQPIHRALREVRRAHLERYKNPLGLLYALYGNGGARFVPNTVPTPRTL